MCLWRQFLKIGFINSSFISLRKRYVSDKENVILFPNETLEAISANELPRKLFCLVYVDLALFPETRLHVHVANVICFAQWFITLTHWVNWPQMEFSGLKSGKWLLYVNLLWNNCLTDRFIPNQIPSICWHANLSLDSQKRRLQRQFKEQK